LVNTQLLDADFTKYLIIAIASIKTTGRNICFPFGLDFPFWRSQKA